MLILDQIKGSTLGMVQCAERQGHTFLRGQESQALV